MPRWARWKLDKGKCKFFWWKCAKQEDMEDNESGCIIYGAWWNNFEPEGKVPLRATQERNFISEAREKKEKLADYFIVEGTVNLQHKMIH